jgi:hypothetical protein
MRLGSLAARVSLKQKGDEPVYQLTCRDRNRIAFQSDLLTAFCLGIDNVSEIKVPESRIDEIGSVDKEDRKIKPAVMLGRSASSQVWVWQVVGVASFLPTIIARQLDRRAFPLWFFPYDAGLQTRAANRKISG